jgi:two-component system, OmpR family, sensor histidine kinase TctE
MSDKQREPGSLFGEILDWMLAPLLLLWPMSLAFTGVVAQEIANLPYDRELGEMAGVLARQIVIDAPGRNGVPAVRLANPAVVNLLRSDDTDQVYYQVLGARGEYVAGDRDLPVPVDLPATRTVKYRDELMRDERVRVAYVWLPLPADPGARGILIQQAETLQKRSRLATEIIKGVAMPQFIILPLAVLLVWLALARGIRPLNALQQRIRKRDSGDLSPIDEGGAPEEVVPLVRAINDLLARLDQSIATQKHFLADAAHQLKTPLAGLRMQAELAEREIDAGQRDPQALKASLHQIALSSQRAAHSVNQLLAMARAEDQESALRPSDVDLATLTQEVVRDLVPKAMDKRIDLGYEGADPGSGAVLSGQPVLLGEMLRNLVDNALQYTPAGGTVTARVTPDPFGQVIVLEVEDTGPGIPAAERELVFQPFYRTLGTGVDGTGLGLAIVQEIAHRHDAEVSISQAHERPLQPGTGLGARFTVRLPIRPRRA